MICECNNTCGGGTHITPAIRHVFGNVLRIAIPLTLRTLVKDGDTIVPTDTDFFPSSDYPVNVIFGKGNKNIAIPAEMDGNVAIIEERGKMRVGTYDITVECRDELGQPYRFKQSTVLQVVDVTAEAGIEPTIEYEAETWYLNAAIFLATTEIGSMTEEIERRLEDVFGGVEYDAENKEIKFYDKNKTHVLGTLDSTPFVVDGTVDDVYIDVDRQVLVVVLNEDAGGRRFSVPLYLIFSSYYKKSEIDERVNNKADVLGDGRVPAAEATPVVLDYFYAPSGVGPVIPINPQAGEVVYFANRNKIRRYYYEDAGQSGGMPAIGYIDETPSRYVVYYNKSDEKFYRYNSGSSSMVEIETGSGGGGEGTVTGIKVGSTTYEPTNGVVDISAGIPDVSGFATASDVADAVADLVDSAPTTLDTLNELAAALGDDPNFATTVTTALGNKVDKESGKSLMTDAEHTKLAGIASGAEANVQADWEQTTTTADDYIKNKPDVPTSISVNQQSYPLNNNHAFVIPDYYTKTQIDNAGYASTADIPTKTSDLTNDSGFLTKVFYKGTCSTSASAMPKVCTVETFPTTTSGNVTHAKDGTIIAVTYGASDTNTTAAPSLNVNSIGAKAISYSNAIVTSEAKNTTVAGTKNNTHYYYYDSTLDSGNGAWVYMFKAPDLNTTYSAMTQAEVDAGSSTTGRIISPKMLRDNFYTEGEVDTLLSAKADSSSLATVATSGSYADLSNKPTIPTVDSTPTQNSTNAVQSGGVYTALAGKQDIINDLATIRSGAGKGATALQPADVSVESPSTPDGTVTINVGDNAYSINLNHSHPQYLKYQLLADEAAYTALATKDSGTLYLIPVTAS